MTTVDEAAPADDELVFEVDLDAPPDKVWRALTITALRERWLPGKALTDPRPVSEVAGEQVRYRLRDDEPPFVESTVTFAIRADGVGGTRLRIIHRPLRDGDRRTLAAANSNGTCLMRAA